MYDAGQGVRQDYSMAVKWFRLAAEQGHANAQIALGTMYENGQGVPQDYVEAYAWYSLATFDFANEQRNEAAIANRDRVSKRMTPAQIAEGEKLSHELDKRISK